MSQAIEKQVVLAALILTISIGVSPGQPPRSAPGDVEISRPATESVPRMVIARVNKHEILLAELQARQRQLPESWQEQRRDLIVETLVQQQLVLDYLDQRSLGATEGEILLEMRRWEKTLAARGMSPAEFFRQTGLDRPALERRFGWSIGWPRFAESKLTDARLEKFFERHKRDFDGTRLRVAHILWPHDLSLTKATEQALQTRAEIMEDKISFAEAAISRSGAPSSDRGGELGWIERRHPMDEAFSAAAFALRRGETSPPVRTPFGTHLIRCLEEKPGEKSLDDVRNEVKTSARNRLFRNLAARQRRTSQIEKVEEKE